jgi:hypothetical protein
MTPSVASPRSTKAERDRKAREAAGVVAGAVERIQDPDAGVGLGEEALLILRGHLLAEQRRGRKLACDGLDDRVPGPRNRPR